MICKFAYQCHIRLLKSYRYFMTYRDMIPLHLTSDHSEHWTKTKPKPSIYFDKNTTLPSDINFSIHSTTNSQPKESTGLPEWYTSLSSYEKRRRILEVSPYYIRHLTIATQTTLILCDHRHLVVLLHIVIFLKFQSILMTHLLHI